MIFAIATALRWGIFHMHVITALQQTEGGIYMYQPQGVVILENEHLLCQPSLYGLKQSPRAGYAAIDKF